MLDNPVKWASLPEWLRADIEEELEDRPSEWRGGSSLTRRTPLKARKGLGVGRYTHLTKKRLRKAVGNESGAPKRYRPAGLKAKLTLKRVGKRGRRLAAGDRRISEMFRAMDCICGCSAEPDPAHLVTRRNESTRHQPHLIIPLCRLGHRWLDQTPEGVQCRAVLLEMAQRKGEMLTHAEFWPVADSFGFYGWMAQQRARGYIGKPRA